MNGAQFFSGTGGQIKTLIAPPLKGTSYWLKQRQ